MSGKPTQASRYVLSAGSEAELSDSQESAVTGNGLKDAAGMEVVWQ